MSHCRGPAAYLMSWEWQHVANTLTVCCNWFRHECRVAVHVWKRLRGCAHVRCKPSSGSQTHSLCQSLINLSGPLPVVHLHASVGQIRPENHRWPYHSRSGNTHATLLLLSVHTHTLTHMWKVIFFTWSWHEKSSYADYFAQLTIVMTLNKHTHKFSTLMFRI